ncbi:MAG: PaaX family transcriptional regulator [Rhizobiaceae bacterium]
MNNGISDPSSLMLQEQNNPVNDLVGGLHGNGKLRVWSIIVTVFGDAIVPRGGIISLASLQKILDSLHIERNALRTAMSRLAQDGWVERHKVGRQSYYSLAEGGLELFQSATARIYSAKPPEWEGKFELVLRSEENQKTRMQYERSMRQKGYGSPIADLYIKPIPVGGAVSQTENCLAIMEAQDLVSGSLADFIARSWKIDDLNSRYQALIEKYVPVGKFLRSRKLDAPIDCLAVRLMLIHDWRKLVLQDADLPSELKPAGWKGEEARTIVAELYRLLLNDSELYLDTCYAGPDVKLPPPEINLSSRFH